MDRRWFRRQRSPETSQFLDTVQLDRSFEEQNTLRADRLPRGEVLDLQYRPQVNWEAVGATVYSCFLLYPVLAVILVLGTRFVGTFNYVINVVTPLGFTVFTITGILWAAGYVVRAEYGRITEPALLLRASAGLWLWLVIASLSRIVSALNAAAFFLFVFAGLAFFVDQVACFYLRWRGAHPQLKRESREQIEAALGKRRLISWEFAAFLALVLLALMLVCVVIPLAPNVPAAASVSLLTFTILAASVARLSRAISPDPSPETRSFFEALACWLEYDSDAVAPGVYRGQGVFQSRLIRVLAFLAVLVLLAASYATSSYYSPLLMLAPEAWKEPAFNTYLDQDRRMSELLPPTQFDLREDAAFTLDLPAPTFLSSKEREALGLALLEQYAEYRDPSGSGSEESAATEDAAGTLEEAEAYYQHFQEGEADTLPLLAHDFQDPQERAFYEALSSEWQAVYRYERYLQFREQNRAEAYQTMISDLNTVPEKWLFAAANGLIFQPTFFIWTFFTSAVLLIVCPGVIFFSLAKLLTRPMLDRVERIIRNADDIYESPWDGFVARLQGASPNAKEMRNSLWLGINEYTESPVVVPSSVLREHAHILGDTGSGKTARALAPMISQLIRLSGRNEREEQSERERPEDARQPTTPPASIVIIDLKGDKSLFMGAKLEAEKAGLKFRYFTNQLHHSTHVFNPFLQAHLPQLTYSDRAGILLQALGLTHGEGYGRGFFSAQNRKMMVRVLQHFGDEIDSFAAFSHRVNDRSRRDLQGHRLQIDERDRDAASEVLSKVELLAKFPPLNVTPGHLEAGVFPNSDALREQIDMLRLFKTPEVIYFYLPAAIQSASVSEIGKLALFSLLSASIQAESLFERRLQVYLFIDEFQQIVSNQLEIILRQARSKNIACILANQTISDLRSPSGDLVPTVQANTRLKQFFASTDLQQQENLMSASGDALGYLTSWSGSTTAPVQETSTYTGALRLKIWELMESVVREERTSRISRNDIIRITDDPALSIVQLSRGAGFAQFGGFPFELRSNYHISSREYDRREGLRWPAASKETIVPTEEHVRWDEVYRPTTNPYRVKSPQERSEEPLLEEPAPTPQENGKSHDVGPTDENKEIPDTNLLTTFQMSTLEPSHVEGGGDGGNPIDALEDLDAMFSEKQVKKP